VKTLGCLQGLLIAIATGWSLSAVAAVIKSVRSGTVAMAAAIQTVNFAAPGVNAARSFVVCQQDQNGGVGGGGSDPAFRATCVLTNNTTLTITTSVANANQTVQWYVAEFLSGVTVQRGLQTIAAASLAGAAIPIVAVNRARSFVLISETLNSTSQTIDERWTVRAQLTSGTNLQLSRDESGTAVTVAWQVVQIDGAAVQFNNAVTTIAAGSVTQTAVLAPPVDPSRTFLVFSRSGGTNVTGEEGLYQVTGELTNSTTVTFTRSSSGGGTREIDIFWFAVRMTDGTTVQRSVAGGCGPSGVPGGSGTATQLMPNLPAGCLTIPTAVTTNRSVPFVSARLSAASTATSNLDDTTWRAGLGAGPTSGAIILTRAGSLTSNSHAVWQVVQFNDKANLIDGDGREIFP